MPELKYSLKKNRIKKAYIEGFEFDGENGLTSATGVTNCIYFEPIDSAMEDSLWGRFFFETKVLGNVSYNIYVGASNHRVAPEEQNRMSHLLLMKALKAKICSNLSDILLYELEGRYIYIGIEVEGDGILQLSDMKLYRQGDNFMQTFPMVYQERNSFFHRYMSVFSSLYNDMEDEIDRLPEILELDTCDVQFLPIYGKWLGIDVGDGFLSENILRQLVKEAYVLNRMKGTRWCLERISEIILGEKGIIIERNTAQEYLGTEQLLEFNRLYGDSVFDVTMLISKKLSEVLVSQLQYILDQFMPIRCRLHIVQLDNAGSLDSHSYLDINAKIYRNEEGALDDGTVMDGVITLV